MKCYFDYASTTPLAPNVLEEMNKINSLYFGNAGSLHSFGADASKILIDARVKVSEFLGCSLSEVIFTSCATESNNLALFGILNEGDHLIISEIEHPSIYEVALILEKKGVEVSFCPVHKNLDGRLDYEKLFTLIKQNTKLISIMYANNEIGVVQDILKISKKIKEINSLKPKNSPKILLHTDATQACAYLPMNVNNDLAVDLLSFSGHKIYGPKGVGVLYIKKGTSIKPIMFGGSQELGLRAGTENVANIAGLGCAIDFIKQNKNKILELKHFRDTIYLELKKAFPNMFVYGVLNTNIDFDNRLPNNLNIGFNGIESESLVYLLDGKGIAVSSVSACSSKALKPSRVILAIGGDQSQARGTIRITLGYTTTQTQVDYLIKTFIDVVSKIYR